jgi:outer membrane protein
MKRFFPMCALILLISASQAFAAAPALKLGAVDLQRTVKECREGIAARAELQKKTEQFNAELKVLQVEYQRLSAELEKDGGKLSVERRAEREGALRKKEREFQNRQREAQEEVKQMESDSLKRLVNRLGVIMAKIGDEGKFTAILDRNNGMFYAGKEIDITSLLIQRADDEFVRQRGKNEDK